MFYGVPVDSKMVVKSDSKIIILICLSKSVTYTVLIIVSSELIFLGNGCVHTMLRFAMGTFLVHAY